MRRPLIAAIVAILVAAAPLVGRPAGAADSAAQVVLRMKGGDFQVTGELRSFDGNRYVIETAQFGRMTLSAARFECIGAACNAPVQAASWSNEPLRPGRSEHVVVRGADVAARGLLPALVKGWAAASGMIAVQVIGPDAATEMRFQLTDQKGRELATISIASEGVGAALAAVEKGGATIALADRAATQPELEALAAAGPKIKTAQHEHVVAMDAMAVVVAPANPLNALPLATLARILTGELTDWYELGLPPGRIQVYAREADTAAADRVDAMVLGGKGRLAASTARVPSEAHLADAVARDPAGIGVVSLAHVRSAKPLGLETGCGLVQRPTAFAVKAEEYPLTYRLALYAAAPPREAAARGLLRFATSAEAQGVIAEAGFVAHTLDMLAVDGQGERMANALNATGDAFDLYHMRVLLADLKGARRLSITVRTTPTGELDQKGRQDLTRLAGLLQGSELAGKRLLILGFSDTGAGKFMAGVTASFKRAANVRAALIAAAGTRLDQRLVVAKGYGPLAPVACNDTADGQRLNRRVEIWLRD